MRHANEQVVVVSHKDYEFPNDFIYTPYFVGKIISEKPIGEDYTLDNEGDNIAFKNKNYCELTAQYSLWKNSHSKIKGLVHYRRHFIGNNKVSNNNKFQQVLTCRQIKELLSKYDMIVPNKRKYYIETIWSHYEHSHHIEGLLLTKKIIQEKYPNYMPAFEKVMNRRWAHMFNMFIAHQNIFDEYSEWLFDVLESVEERLDISNYSEYESRVFGFISELLLDVWIETNDIRYVEQKVYFMEPQNWFKKGKKFIMRKLKGGIID